MSYLVKGAPFRYKGAKNVENCKTAEEVINAAGLDWEVSKCELFAKMPVNMYEWTYTNSDVNKDIDESFIRRGANGDAHYKVFPKAFATYRTDYNIPLGIVQSRYTPVQNVDAFKFFDGAIGKDKAIWQTAGYFGNGERIFVSAKLPSNILVNNDPVENYLVFTTSHDGTSGVRILFTPIRVICENTLNAAIRKSTNYVTFRHTQSVHEKLDTAAEILGITQEISCYLNEQFNYMWKTPMSDNDAQTMFAKVILSENEQTAVVKTGHTLKDIVNRKWDAIQDAGVSMKKVNVLSEMNNYYYNGAGQREIVGTAWGVYNAVTGYYSNVDNSEGPKRMDSLLYGDKSRKIELAGNLLIAA